MQITQTHTHPTHTHHNRHHVSIILEDSKLTYFYKAIHMVWNKSMHDYCLLLQVQVLKHQLYKKDIHFPFFSTKKENKYIKMEDNIMVDHLNFIAVCTDTPGTVYKNLKMSYFFCCHIISIAKLPFFPYQLVYCVRQEVNLSISQQFKVY